MDDLNKNQKKTNKKLTNLISEFENKINKVIENKYHEYKQKIKNYNTKNNKKTILKSFLYKCYVCKTVIVPNKICSYHAYDHIVCEICYNKTLNDL